MNLKALQDCVIMERDVEKHAFLELPQTTKLGTGVVLSAGPDCTEVKVGDRVYFDVGQEFRHEGHDYVLMRERHILGVFDG
jgi:co-chaperonin GroES (HSP10)